jgi:FkbM family methyltransferase
MTARASFAHALRRAGELCFGAARRVHVPAQQRRVIPWEAVRGDSTLRLDYDLNESSIVFDAGGYEGQWSSDIFSMYRCAIHIFEPVPDYAKGIRRRFRRNPRISVHDFGLSGRTRLETIGVAGNASSVFKADRSALTIRLRSAGEFIRSNGIERIDLLKVNIEGLEYELLEHLLGEGLMARVVDLQVQFHDFVDRAPERMKAIQRGLGATHSITYQYPFVWENWRLKTNCG